MPPSSVAPVTEGAPAHGTVAHLLPQTYQRLVSEWLEEDTPSYDYGGFVVGEAHAEARLLGKSHGVVAGMPFFDEVFRQLDCTVEWHVHEGDVITPVKHCATVRGPVRKVLLGERVALNTLSRCSGVATQSARTLQLVRGAGYPNTLAGTRKTTPGFRLVEKYGMLVGGADGHRHDLSSMVMLKDNHIWACSGAASSGSRSTQPGALPASTGASTSTTTALAPSADASAPPVAENAEAITRAVRSAKSAAGFAIKVEVECQSEAEAEAAVRAGADVVMLDNFSPADLRHAAKSLKERLKKGEGFAFLIEVSGGLTDDNVKDYVCEHVDIISTSSIHQGVKHVDFSLKVVPGAAGQEGAAAV